LEHSFYSRDFGLQEVEGAGRGAPPFQLDLEEELARSEDWKLLLTRDEILTIGNLALDLLYSHC
jgi:hypothetical protein